MSVQHVVGNSNQARVWADDAGSVLSIEDQYEYERRSSPKSV